jgi:ribosomal protein L40E
MQATTRCPKCGYVLRYDGSSYRCDFCGYFAVARRRTSISERIDSLERGLRQSVIRFLEPRQNRDPTDFRRVMPATRPCISCGTSLPLGATSCSKCGASQTPTQVAADNTSADWKVYDYILAHEGTISMSQASNELSISQETLSATIERLKASGLLSQA